MPTTPVYGQFQTIFGAAREVAGQGVAVNTPTHFIPALQPKPKDDIKFYEDKAFRGLPTETFGHYQLLGWSTVDWDGPFYPDDAALPLVGIVGNWTEVAAPSATTLSGGVSAGAFTVNVTSATGYQAGAAVIIESGVAGKQESNVIQSIASNTLTLFSPLRFAHSSGAAISSNALHNLTAISPYFGNTLTSSATTTFTATTAKDTANPVTIRNQYVGHTITAGANSATVVANDTSGGFTTTTWAPGTPTANTVFTVAAMTPGQYIQPPTYTVYDFYGENQRVYSNSFISDWALKWSTEGETTYTAKTMGLLSNTASAVSSASFTTLPPFVGWQSGFAQTLSGSGGTPTARNNLIDATITLKRTITPVTGAYNTQSPTAFFPGPVNFAIQATLQLQDEVEINHFRNSDHPKMQFGLYGPAGYPSGTPTATGLLLTMDNPTVTVMDIQRSKAFFEVGITIANDYNATDNGPAQFQLTNASATLYDT